MESATKEQLADALLARMPVEAAVNLLRSRAAAKKQPAGRSRAEPTNLTEEQYKVYAQVARPPPTTARAHR